MVFNKIFGGSAFRIAVGIMALVLVMAGGAGATKFINNNATGGDCISIGTWDDVTKTCTLTTDLTETIQIDSNGITLDGNGHTISGNNTGNGVYLSGRTGITIKNLNVEKFSYGIYLYYSSNNTLTNNKANSNKYEGFTFEFSSNNTLSGNNVSYNWRGIDLHWISNNNTIYNNYFSNTYDVN